MNLAADLPVTLVVKAANQRVADQTVECVLGWTIRKLKQHLESVYPSKPKHHQQKLIYSGKLLADHLTLKEVLRQYDEENSYHTVHLVCSPSAESLVQPGPSQSSTALKSELHTNVSQTSTSSLNESSDGVRRRGSRISSAASSSTEIPNTGVNPAMAAAGGPGMMQMPGMGGMPMMGGMPPMGMPGYPYTPEQMAYMQQMYSQYMAQYMQYYGYQIPQIPAVPQQQPNPVQAPAPQQAANPPPANNAPANQNMRMNAQGGLEEDDEEEQRDWLDYIYVFFRFLVLVSIVYFYSSASRFMTVVMGFFAFYLLQNGWAILNRRQQQQQQQAQQQAQQIPAQQQQAEQQQQQPEAERQNDEARQPEAQERGEQDSAAREESTETTQEAPVPPPPEVPSTATVLLRMLVTFFTSLVPAQPPAVNGN